MSGQSFSTAAVIDKGFVRLKDRSSMLQWANSVGDGVELVVEIREKKDKRSLKANRAYWGLLVTPLAEHLGYDRDEIDDLHEGLLMLYSGTHVDKVSQKEVPNKRSRKMTTSEFHDFMEWTVRYAAKEHGIDLELPDDTFGQP